MKRIRTALSGCAIALSASLLLARVHPFGDAGLYATNGAQPIMEHSGVPSAVRATLAAKCADCHSTQARAPFYGRFAPVSWLLERDILEGRKAMNLSEWDQLSADRRQTLEAKIVHETKAHEMPLLQYRMIHWNARVTDADLRAFSEWTRGTSGGEAGSTAAGEGDAVRGQDVFERRCTGCHSLTRNLEGPSLQGVYGRAAGSLAGFAYSPALKNAHIVWDSDSLERWLADPDAFVAGNNMDFHVPKAQEREDLIAFLKRDARR